MIEGLFWVAGLSMTLAQMADRMQSDRTNLQAAAMGSELRTLNAGLDARLHTEPGMANGTYQDWTFLRSAACGGTANTNFVPCDFTIDSTRIGRLFEEINIVTVNSSYGDPVQVATVSLGPLTRSTAEAADPAFSGLVASYANGFTYGPGTGDASGRRLAYTTDAANGRMLATSSVAPEESAYIRKDGTTPKRGNIHFATLPDGTEQYDILNTREIVAQSMRIGAETVVDPSGESSFQQLVVNNLALSTFRDSDDTRYYYSFENGSFLNDLHANEVVFTRHVQKGDTCSEPFTLARDEQGFLLWCADGRWGEPQQGLPAGAIISSMHDSCPEGYTEWTRGQGRILKPVSESVARSDRRPHGWGSFRMNRNMVPYARANSEGPGTDEHGHGQYVYEGCFDSPCSDEIAAYWGQSLPLYSAGWAKPVLNRMPYMGVNWCVKL